MALERSLDLQELRSKIKGNVFDIVIFGSAVKGKYKPRDIDVCVIFDGEVELETLSEIRGHVSYIRLQEIYTEPLWRTIILEGFSVKKNKRISEFLGTESHAIFKYDLKRLNKVDKVKFAYGLRGRNGQKGVIQKVCGKKLGRMSLMVPTENSEMVRQFLEDWGVDYEVEFVLAQREDTA